MSRCGNDRSSTPQRHNSVGRTHTHKSIAMSREQQQRRQVSHVLHSAPRSSKMHNKRSWLITGLLAPLSHGAYISSNLVRRQPPALEHAFHEYNNGWKYEGCYAEKPGGRALSRAAFSSDEMGGNLCVNSAFRKVLTSQERNGAVRYNNL